MCTLDLKKDQEYEPRGPPAGPALRASPAACYVRCGCKLDELLGQSIVGGKLKTRTLRANNSSHISLAQPCSQLDECIEHGLQIERRPADDLEHVGGGRLLLQ